MRQDEFAALAEPHRRELRAHCYRMTGSYDEAEDLVQETFLRAWKNIDGFAAWLQPCPEPDAAAVATETVELAFLVTNSALQRARATLRDHLPRQRLDWTPPAAPSAGDRAVVRRYVTALERADLTAIAELLAEDVRATMPPYPQWFADRASVLAALTATWDPASPDWVGRFRAAPTRANGRPAVAAWTTRDGERYHAFALTVLEIEDGRVVAMTAFHEARLFDAAGLPMSFRAGDRLPGDHD